MTKAGTDTRNGRHEGRVEETPCLDDARVSSLPGLYAEMHEVLDRLRSLAAIRRADVLVALCEYEELATMLQQGLRDLVEDGLRHYAGEPLGSLERAEEVVERTRRVIARLGQQLVDARDVPVRWYASKDKGRPGGKPRAKLQIVGRNYRRTSSRTFPPVRLAEDPER